jgi:benzoate membrane transport protein
VTVNTNIAGIIYLRSEGYDPPERVMQLSTGIGTMVGSFFGAAPVSVGTLILPLVAGPEAGDRERRQWAIYTTVAGFTAIALLAGIAAQLPDMIPTSLLLAIAGLGLLPVLGQVLGEVTRGPLRLGPLFAFVVASSRLSLWGFGPSFWALVIGVGVSLLLENDQLRALRVAAAQSGA